MDILIKYDDLDRFIGLFSGFKHSKIEELKNKEAKEFILFINKIKVRICDEYEYGSYLLFNENPKIIKIKEMEIPCFSLEDKKKAIIRFLEERKKHDSISLYTHYGKSEINKKSR